MSRGRLDPARAQADGDQAHGRLQARRGKAGRPGAEREGTDRGCGPDSDHDLPPGRNGEDGTGRRQAWRWFLPRSPCAELAG